MPASVEIRNVSPLGDLEVAAYGDRITVAAGATAKVPPELAESLLAQPDNWQPVTPAAAKEA